MQIVEMLTVIKSIIHTFVRFMPLGIYFFVYFSIILFKDMRAALILLGLVINDVINYAYKRYYKVIDNLNCSIMGKPDGTPAPPLPTSHVQYLTFIFAIFVSSNIYKRDKNIVSIIFLGIMIAITGWSRVKTGCKENMEKVVYEVIFGLLRGAIYFFFISGKWSSIEKGMLERKACDLGYKDYKCSTIKDGVVIVKKEDKQLEEAEEKCKKKEKEEQDEIYDKYYD